MRYAIDTTDNGYVLTVRNLIENRVLTKMVFTDLQSVFQEVDRIEAERGRTA